ncbi:hypothetical protein D3C71_2145580 [compost metagenome]
MVAHFSIRRDTPSPDCSTMALEIKSSACTFESDETFFSPRMRAIRRAVRLAPGAQTFSYRIS